MAESGKFLSYNIKEGISEKDMKKQMLEILKEGQRLVKVNNFQYYKED